MGTKYRKERLLPILREIATTNCWLNVISGITGNVSINDNGDRDADYALLDMDPETGIFQVFCQRLTFLHFKQILILITLISACCNL